MNIRTVAVLLAAAAATAMALNARAEVPANAPGLSKTIFAEIDALARKTRQSGTLPRWSDAAHRAVLARFWDEDALLGHVPHNAADVPLLLDIGEDHKALLTTYLLFTRKAGDLPDMAANGFAFQDELSRTMAFQVAWMGAGVPAIEDFAAGLPAADLTEIRRQGLREMRLGFVELIASAGFFIRSPQLSDENREIVAKALARHAETLARSLLPEDRQAAAANARATLPALRAGGKADMQTFIAAMSQTRCDALCAIQ